MKPVFKDKQSELDAGIRWVYVGKKFTDDAGIEWEVIYDNEHWSEHRWYFVGLIVVKCTDDAHQYTWGHKYLSDKSELQESQFNDDEYWFGASSKAYDWSPVFPKIVVTYDLA